ncbi:transcription/translation regulatory transformer protein RfaH [Ferrovum sp. PN-J185]|uniref:transcription/translation regulatory transformer protein RfaH n=1 Tax=Ferrovum sp. PN-J185 TaxID=1356306 RepID=UPI001E405980|nr:transcription/translation regulatory transformer protein RfaH [Ferrovum sp. PN-J185]MCC6067926.1 transcription/translation regulatory transformer protein RfaH [Ferrovum sp. PN-J185]MDE1891269.1 transcription/translation regulatory transformer protein RfaH [Betaproteobacteria bacterium]MDE2056309.1 transcription/translation regulatory transformer protein RfaH [Betaproteobacteria bacterium]
MKKWYVVQAKPRDEERAELELANQGFTIYLPKIVVEKKKSNKIQKVQEPLFPRYLFIQLDYTHDDSYTIRSTRGVGSGLLLFGGTPAIVPDVIIEDIRSMCENSTAYPKPLYQQGDTLLVREGPFKGLIGVLEKINAASTGEARVLVLIELLGKIQRLTFPINQVTLA